LDRLALVSSAELAFLDDIAKIFSETVKNLTASFQVPNIILQQTTCSENSVWPDLSILYFRLKVIPKSYRQVLTPVKNSQLLLKLEILDKLRLVTFQKIQHKDTATNWFIPALEK